jgi:hypothetical protein
MMRRSMWHLVAEKIVAEVCEDPAKGRARIEAGLRDAATLGMVAGLLASIAIAGMVAEILAVLT